MTMQPFAPQEVAPLLRAGTEILRAEIGGLHGQRTGERPAPDQWCINEVIGHLIEAERRGFAGRIRTILSADKPRLEGWDPPAVAIARGDCERKLIDLLAEFEALRSDSVALVRGLQPGDLERAGLHPDVGELRVRDLLHEWVFHDRAHLQQILNVVQQMVWPHMGNARRFSRPDAE
jgi:hypothetical protein